MKKQVGLICGVLVVAIAFVAAAETAPPASASGPAPKGKPSQPYQNAVDSLFEGKFDESIKWLHRTISDFPDSREAANSHCLLFVIGGAVITSYNVLSSAARNGRDQYNSYEMKRKFSYGVTHSEFMSSFMSFKIREGLGDEWSHKNFIDTCP
ncbi:MAG: hypothetical protein ACRD2L_19740, partial [Terriglobia bacterium]